ncbi:hypothetical protein Vafri_8968 [Volvox africanus]|uniref:UDP-N-acetylglucosamine diphosphorylase n=1 Tax=Volvox africanus TaxID=51714 RepID=A0A8J4B4X9_9CHLO|nr:hypothetical protein Vafri_8968 [Volvox africanus]
MTSTFTHADTLAHFEAHNFFGLAREQVTFFQQGFLPCFTEDGKLILETQGSLAKAPDGNGGVYLSLARSGILDAMAAAGIECLDCYCVDNSLARLGDPRFIGYCHGVANADVGARVVAKAYPEEKVGVFALRRAAPDSTTGPDTASPGALTVLEYSELDPDLAASTDPSTGHLYFNWSNICMHYFSVNWLRNVATQLLAGGSTPYHVARKRIPSVIGPVSVGSAGCRNSRRVYRSPGQKLRGVRERLGHQRTQPQESTPTDQGSQRSGSHGCGAWRLLNIRRLQVPGIKLELFIFDTFPLAGDKTALVQVDRREDFAPVKNAPGSAIDSPNTARSALLSLHAGWVRNAGAEVTCDEGVEVSPLVSYAGEGLESIVLGKTYNNLFVLELQQPSP